VAVIPIRLAPLPGEALDSWLEAYADLLHVTVRDIFAFAGASWGRATGQQDAGKPWLVQLNEPDLAALSAATGVTPETLAGMTLARYQGTGLAEVTAPPGMRRTPRWWRQLSCSRYCPRCLAANGGRWMLAWRIPWAFACTGCRVLLADTCPDCGRRHRRTRTAQPRQPGRCDLTGLPLPPPRPPGATTFSCTSDPVGTPAVALPAGAHVLATRGRPSPARAAGSRAALIAAVTGAGLLGAIASAPADAAQRFSPRALLTAPLRLDPALSPLSEVREQVRQPTPSTLFTATITGPASRAVLMQTVALDSFDGAEWTSSDSYLVAGPVLGAVPAIPDGVRLTEHVALRSLAGPYLPVSGRPTRVDASLGPGALVGFDPESGTLVANAASLAGASYTVVATGQPEHADLMHAAAGSGPSIAPYLQLPPVPAQLAFSSKGTLATGDNEGDVYLWDAATGARLATLDGIAGGIVHSIAFSPNADLVAATINAGPLYEVYVWNAAGNILSVFRCSVSIGGTMLAFSPDGKSLAVGDENAHTYIWDVSQLGA
jgi:hypothetical protein